MTDLKTYTVKARVTFSGATMEVEARSPEEARMFAEKNPDFDIATAEMSDWVITGAKEEPF